MKRKVDYKKLEIIVLVFLIIAFAIIAGLNKSGTAYFNPTNGTYQNYNPVRRLLAGQVPFRDFAVYLGTGHLYSLSFFQLIYYNTFFEIVKNKPQGGRKNERFNSHTRFSQGIFHRERSTLSYAGAEKGTL